MLFSFNFNNLKSLKQLSIIVQLLSYISGQFRTTQTTSIPFRSAEDTRHLPARSGNDCATALAIYHSGSVEQFAEVMNDRAKKIGAQNSNSIIIIAVNIFVVLAIGSFASALLLVRTVPVDSSIAISDRCPKFEFQKSKRFAG